MKRISTVIFMAVALLLPAAPAMSQDKGVTTRISEEDLALYQGGINPADLDVDTGGEFFNKTQGSKGKSCSGCHEGAGAMKKLDGVVADYPKWSDKAGRVLSLEDQINMCLKMIGADTLKHKSGAMNAISLYVRSLSQGAKINARIDGPAQATYEFGKKVYETRRGQRNFACHTCHNDLAGSTIRMQALKNITGAAAHWPAYRMKNGQTTQLQRRFQQCMKNARMKVFPMGDYRMVALELYVTSLANGYPIKTPGWVR